MIDRYIDIGKLIKKHGLNGDIIMRVEEGYLEDVKKTAKIFIEHHGQKIPYFIESLKDAKMLILRLEDIENPEEADKLTSKTVFLHHKDVNESFNESSVHPFDFVIGMQLLDKNIDSIVGIVVEVVSYPQQEMAIVKNGNRTFLIPLVEEFNLSIDEKSKIISMELPQGLLNL